jgi:hypothetical protein
MSSLFRKLPITDLFKKVVKMTGLAVEKKAGVKATPAPADDKPAAGMGLTAATEEARRRSGRRRARRTGGMRLLMSQSNQGGDQKKTTLGPQ